MKIIFSPTKSMDFSNPTNSKINPINLEKTKEIFSILCSFTKEDLEKVLKIKGKTLDKTFDFYKKINLTKKAISSYNGVSFKEIKYSSYNEKQLNYLNSNVVILSAMYGAIKPFDYISQYRLDMTIKVFKDKSLYNYWKEDIDSYFKDEKMIVNLASKEFSKTINFPMINIDFKEYKNHKFQSVSSYSKKARGLMLNYMVENNITEISQIKKFNLDGYSLNKDLSNLNNLIFTR